MASFEKRPDGRWRASVQRKGVRRSKLCATRREAQDWATRQEHLILEGAKAPARDTFGEVLRRYVNEVSPTKRGERWEIGQVRRLRKDRIAAVPIADLTPAIMADWRDRRLQEVQPATVLREMNFLGAVFTRARREWGLIDASPMPNVVRPAMPRARDRVATPDEMKRLAYCAGDGLGTATGRAFHAFLFACETAMRAGEIVGLEWDRVFLADRYVHLPVTKNGHPRDVPLSSEAVRLIEALPHADPVFGLTGQQLDVLWRKVRDRAKVEDLHFHDSRRMGTAKLAKKLDALELAKCTGHRDLRILLNTYYKTSASELAGKLG